MSHSHGMLKLSFVTRYKYHCIPVY